jgi:hypothetical protein
VVVHLDLPWTPARLAQRVGRCARPGAPHAAVHVHALRPAVDEARWLSAAARLRRKARAARTTLGARGEPAAALARLLERWLLARSSEEERAPRGTAGRAIAVAAPARGALAALRAPDGTPVLVAVLGGRVRADARALARAARRLDAAAAPVALASRDRAALVGALRRWCRRRRAADALSAPHAAAPSAAPSATVRHTLARLDACVRTAPAHRRAARAATAAGLRAHLARPVGAGVERALAAASVAAPDDDTWLAAVHTLLPSADAPARHVPAPRWRLVALAALVPPLP